MKKVIILMAVLTAITIMTGCGDDVKPETQANSGNVEEIVVEKVLVEDVQTEETITERVYIDNEFENELEYNSRVNTWDSGNNITYWN